ncbi:CvpA family protein [Piscinibacter sakaiensis]|uniref:CvpA family protein n=1 Tax=Piscinibacter sakaiensis TaxID=1547922 RepID=UPI00372ABD56
MPTWPPAWNGVDAAFAATLVLSLALGVLRGFVFEVMSLAGWLVAYAAAYLFSPRLLPLLPAEPAGGATVVGLQAMPLLAFVLCFFAALIGWTLLSHLLRLLVRATPLSGPDRLLGAVFGLLRGALLVLAVVVGVELTPWLRGGRFQARMNLPCAASSA